LALLPKLANLRVCLTKNKSLNDYNEIKTFDLKKRIIVTSAFVAYLCFKMD